MYNNNDSLQELETRVVAQAQNHVLSSYGLAEPADYLVGLNKTANYNDDIQDLYNYAVGETIQKLANEGLIETEQPQELSAEDIVSLIQTQAENDALVELNQADPVDYLGHYGLSKTANDWPEECTDFYAEVYNSTKDMSKEASADEFNYQRAQNLVDDVTYRLFNINMKKSASMLEYEIAQTLKNV